MTPFFEKLWHNYEQATPTAERVRKSLSLDNYEYFNDHVAFRSLGLKGYGIKTLIKPFIKEGYKQSGEYYFEEKKLRAVHLETTSNTLLPKVFISELILDKFSERTKNTLINSFSKIKNKKATSDLLIQGRKWPYVHQTYLNLRKESEYAAWIYAHGYRVNHFTIRINSLQNTNINEVCELLIRDGITLNNSGGVIKGSKKAGLQQASTSADIIKVQCSKTKIHHEIPSCYVEFAERFDVKGKQFNGFITKSADHIFESTDQKK